MKSNIVELVNKQLINYDGELKDLIVKLLEDFNKKDIRINKIIKQSDRQQSQLIKLNEELEKSYEKLKIVSQTDKLTSLYNRFQI